MRLYDRYILPKLIDSACSGTPTQKQRAKIIPLATGDVLEIGIGPGKNLPYYDSDKVAHIWAIDPSPELLTMAEENVAASKIPVTLMEANGEQIPLDDNRFDTVVSTYTLCSIPRLDLALSEIARVLKPDGQFLFCEHGAAPDNGVRRLQNGLTPIWKRVGGGCHLNRDIASLVRAAGFTMEWVDTMYIPGPKFASFNYWGVAKL